jgi:hypothetical protein
MARGASHLEGMGGCLAALKDLTKRVESNVGKRALRTTAQDLADRHKATLPVSDSPHDKTRGSLKASPTVASAKGRKGRPAVAMIIEDPAAAPGEFGTSKMPAHLKVRATTDAMRSQLAGTLGDALKSEVDAASRSAARKGGK